MGIRCADHVTPLYPQKLALTSPTDGGRSVGIVRSRTKATEFFFICLVYKHIRKTHCVPCNVRAETENICDSLNITTEIDWILCKLRTEIEKRIMINT